MEQNEVRPMLDPSPDPQSPRKRRRWPLIVATILGLLVVLGAGSYVVVTKVIGAFEKGGNQVAENVLGPLRDGEQGRLWAEAAPHFKEQIPEAEWNAVLGQIDQTFGRPLSWTVFGVGTDANLGPNGPVRSTTYSLTVTCEKGQADVTITIDGEGRLLGLNFKPT